MTISIDYQPRHRSQLHTADPIARFGCAAYSMAMLVDRATLGGVVVSGAQLRALTDEPVPNPKSPGLTVGQVATAAQSRLHVPIGLNLEGRWEVLLANLGGRDGLSRGFLLPGVYGRLPVALRGIPTFTDAHSVYVDRLAPGRAVAIVGDPLQAHFVEWPLAALRAYWSAYGTTYAFSRHTGDPSLA